MSSKNKEKSSQMLYNVLIFTNGATDEDTLDAWTDELMEAAENVGTAEWIITEEYDNRELEILEERFPAVNQQQPFFQINEIDYAAIRDEVEKMESTQKWRKFFRMISSSAYIEIEDRVVSDARRAVFCTNNLAEAERFLVRQANNFN